MKRTSALFLLLAGFLSSGSIACSAAAPSNDGTDEIDGVTHSALITPVDGNDDQCNPVDCPGYKPHPPGWKPPPPPPPTNNPGPCGTPFGACCYSNTGAGYCNYVGVSCQSGTCQECGTLGEKPCITGGCSAGTPIDGTCQSCSTLGTPQIKQTWTSDTSVTIDVISTHSVSSQVVFTNQANASDTKSSWGVAGTDVAYTFTGLKQGATYTLTVKPGGPSASCASTSFVVAVPHCGADREFTCAGQCNSGVLHNLHNGCGNCGGSGGEVCAGNVCTAQNWVPIDGTCQWNPSCGHTGQTCCPGLTCIDSMCNSNAQCTKNGGSSGGGSGGSGGNGGLGSCPGGGSVANHYACVTCLTGSPETITRTLCSDDAVASQVYAETGCPASAGKCTTSITP